MQHLSALVPSARYLIAPFLPPVSAAFADLWYNVGLPSIRLAGAFAGLDHTRCADSHEDRTFAQCADDAIQFERHFAEPADVWSNATSAVAPGISAGGS